MTTYLAHPRRAVAARDGLRPRPRLLHGAADRRSVGRDAAPGREQGGRRAVPEGHGLRPAARRPVRGLRQPGGRGRLREVPPVPNVRVVPHHGALARHAGARRRRDALCHPRGDPPRDPGGDPAGLRVGRARPGRGAARPGAARLLGRAHPDHRPVGAAQPPAGGRPVRLELARHADGDPRHGHARPADPARPLGDARHAGPGLHPHRVGEGAGARAPSGTGTPSRTPPSR